MKLRCRFLQVKATNEILVLMLLKVIVDIIWLIISLKLP